MPPRYTALFLSLPLPSSFAHGTRMHSHGYVIAKFVGLAAGRKAGNLARLREPNAGMFSCVIRNAAALRFASMPVLGGRHTSNRNTSLPQAESRGRRDRGIQRESRRVYSQGKGASNVAMPHAELLCCKFRVMRGRRCQCRADVGPDDDDRMMFPCDVMFITIFAGD